MYAASSVNAPATCEEELQSRTCSDGEWQEWTGGYLYVNCTVMSEVPTYSPTIRPSIVSCDDGEQNETKVTAVALRWMLDVKEEDQACHRRLCDCKKSTMEASAEIYDKRLSRAT